MSEFAECRLKSIALSLLLLPATRLPLITIFGGEWKCQLDASDLYIGSICDSTQGSMFSGD
jgi:hypothetical protein